MRPSPYINPSLNINFMSNRQLKSHARHQKKFKAFASKCSDSEYDALVREGENLLRSSGKGMTEENIRAFGLFQTAANGGHLEAQFKLGVCYCKGKGVPQDHAEAVKWFRKAAEQGDANAQDFLGVCYSNGEGVPQDHAEAARWHRKAAAQGYAKAQYNLGVCYSNGECQRRSDSRINWAV